MTTKRLLNDGNFLDELVKEFSIVIQGVRITKDLVLGKSNISKIADAMPSLNLSSGEKQLLGFLCYNGLFDVKTIFIDEPELSLHPDWQRLLSRLLVLKERKTVFHGDT